MAYMDRADRYSRLVGLLKIILPLVALGILSTLFFVAKSLDPEAAIPFAKVDVERILREQGITKPVFGGVTSDGARISLTADSVRPGTDQRSQLVGETLSADLSFPGRGDIMIQSPEGIIDIGNAVAILQGGARLESSTGYLVETDRIVTSYAEAVARADHEVRASGPAGTLTAGSMELVRSNGETSGYLLVFKNGVRLLYDPEP